MARQVGHVKYQGTIGDIRHFKIKGLKGNYGGLIGGPTAEQVKNDVAFERTRENMNEFGGCAVIAKSVRVGLAQLIKQMSDPQLAGRLTGIMKKINLEDKSEARGYLAILVSTQRDYLKGLNFNRHINFESIFFAPFTLSHVAERNASTLTVPVFDTLKSINAPAGATHFRLINAISVVSDYAYNATTKVYEPTESLLNETSNVAYSDYIELGVETEPITEIESALPDSPTLTDNVSVLNSIGIEFYQKIGQIYYLFNSGNALKVQDIF